MTLHSAGVVASGLAHAVGVGVESLWDALVNRRTALRKNDLEWCDLDCWIGRVAGVENISLPAYLSNFDCRNHRLAWLALQDDCLRRAIDMQISRHGKTRVGLVVGTSTSGIQSTEWAYKNRISQGKWPDRFVFKDTHPVDSLCRFICNTLDIQGPAVGIVSACASSAKVFLVAQKWLCTGLVDAVLVGGVDSLCLSTLHGFNALQLLSDEACRPFDRQRNGISIGEAAGFVLLTRKVEHVNFIGGADSSDAHHITAPHPEGEGACLAMQTAMAAAGIVASDIDYVNAHGTATQSNDRVEARALQRVFVDHPVAVSSTKGTTGHTLGAAGILEAIITIQTIHRQMLPPFKKLESVDGGVELNLVTETVTTEIRYAMTNNFGFGGTNCSLIFGRLN